VLCYEDVRPVVTDPHFSKGVGDEFTKEYGESAEQRRHTISANELQQAPWGDWLADELRLRTDTSAADFLVIGSYRSAYRSCRSDRGADGSDSGIGRMGTDERDGLLRVICTRCTLAS